LQIQTNKSFCIFKDIFESQIYPSFIVDKSGKILYSNKGGAQIMSKRFDPLFLGKKTSINCVQDLVHESSIDTLKSLIDDSNNKKDANSKESHIAILQNIKLQKNCQDLTEGIASLIINNNLVYYKVKAFSSNWKSGN
jgi:hypothetical protein